MGECNFIFQRNCRNFSSMQFQNLMFHFDKLFNLISVQLGQSFRRDKFKSKNNNNKKIIKYSQNLFFSLDQPSFKVSSKFQTVHYEKEIKMLQACQSLSSAHIPTHEYKEVYKCSFPETFTFFCIYTNSLLIKMFYMCLTPT